MQLHIQTVVLLIIDFSENGQAIDEFHYLRPMIRTKRSSDMTMVQRKKKTGLMDLPAELRNDIQRLVVVTDHIIVVCSCP